MMDPFFPIGPTCISFSGGRTSAYMLWRVLEACGGALSEDTVVCFANTGKEEVATLDFVRECGERWNVPIVWVEYRDDDAGYAVVTYETASRNGDPFESLILKRNYLPNPVTRFCTIGLKIRPIARYLNSVGMSDTVSAGEHMSWVGIRADEPRRAAKIGRDRCPLVLSGVTLRDVDEFWSTQPFGLRLPTTPSGRTLAGNCDLCFLKPANQIFTLIAEKPERADWWIRMEALALALASKPSGARFRNDRPGYAQMRDYAAAQRDMFDADEPSIECFCGD